MKFTAIVPVKANSSRLPGKNLKPFGSENLLTRKIRQLKQAGIADRIVVSSDSDEMLDIAIKHGIEAIKRPKHFADESRPFGEFLDYISNEIVKDGHLIYSCVTSPFLDEKLMIETKNSYLKALQEGHDSLITVYKLKHYILDKNGPINFKMGMQHKNSEYLEGLDFFTNGILFAPIESVKKWHYNYGPKAYRFEVDQKASIDIDTKYDYLTALAWLNEDKLIDLCGGGADKCLLKITQTSQSSWESWWPTFGDYTSAHALDSVFASISLNSTRFTREVA